MLKVKYLHRKPRPIDSHWNCDKKYKRIKNMDIFSELPMHESIGKKYKWVNYDLTPLREFLESKIGCDWNDIYSEIVSKTKKNIRYIVDNFLKYSIVFNPIYDKNFIPRGGKYRAHMSLEDRLFIDLNNKLVRKTLEEILIDSKKYLRKKKIQEILEYQEQEEKIENKDINLFPGL